MNTRTQARFDPKDNMVLDLQDVDISCTGRWLGMLPWSYQSCGIEARMGWLEAAQKIALQVTIPVPQETSRALNLDT